jgi:hypothetical protein
MSMNLVEALLPLVNHLPVVEVLLALLVLGI